jgi:hypothetical protein
MASMCEERSIEATGSRTSEARVDMSNKWSLGPEDVGNGPLGPARNEAHTEKEIEETQNQKYELRY